MKEKLHKTSNEIYVIIIGDYSVSIYRKYISNSQNTHEVYQLKSNFNYFFGYTFRLIAAIRFQHNTAFFKK